MKLYLNLKNAWKVYILVFILSSCSDIGGIVEVAVKDSVNSPLDSKEIIKSVDNTNMSTSHKEKITQNNTNIQTLPKTIIHNINGYLRLEDLSNILLTNKYLYSLCKNERSFKILGIKSTE